MKTSVLFATFSIIALSVFLFWARYNFDSHSVDISAVNEDDTYTFTAHYDRADTRKVEAYINKCISPDQMGSSENDYIDATTTLDDHTTFYIKESPGRLKIRINKRNNQVSSYIRIKNMCDGVKNLLGGGDPTPVKN